MWTDITRRRYARADLLLPSDLTDAEWEILEPLLPVRGKLGRPPVWDYRQIVEAILYLLRGGLPWRMLPPGLFPPMTTVQHYLGIRNFWLIKCQRCKEENLSQRII
jgi:transposase